MDQIRALFVIELIYVRTRIEVIYDRTLKSDNEKFQKLKEP